MDLELVETGNGGELVKKTNDVSVIDGLENMPYLAMFGGNTQADTPSKRNILEQDFSWWGNAFLSDPGLQFNSLTERTLCKVALTASGRVEIQAAVKKDLEFMNQFANVTSVVAFLGLDRIAIVLRIVRPTNLQRKEFIFIWDATNRELIERSVIEISITGNPLVKIFDFSFDFSFE